MKVKKPVAADGQLVTRLYQMPPARILTSHSLTAKSPFAAILILINLQQFFHVSFLIAIDPQGLTPQTMSIIISCWLPTAVGS